MLSGNALRAARSSLRTVSTVVTHRDGHRTVETSDGIVTGNLPPPDVLPPALTNDLANTDGSERRRLHDELSIKDLPAPTWSMPPSLVECVSRIPPVSLTSVTVVTWNVWFAPVDVDVRMARLFHEALDAAPDVLCLQEVVPELAASIRACEPLQQLFDISPNDVGAYGCLLLVRRELSAAFSEVPFPTSNMGRSLLVAEWSPPLEGGCTVAVGTVHLESLNCAEERARQLRIAKDALAGARRRVILCGDFNFDATQNWGDWRRKAARWPTGTDTVRTRPERPRRDPFSALTGTDTLSTRPNPPRRDPPSALENAVLARVLGGDYVDAWPAVRPEDPGITFDGAVNPYVADCEERMRYDRVMVKGFVPRSVDLLGLPYEDGTVPEVSSGTGTRVPVVPSDHFGLRAVVDLR